MLAQPQFNLTTYRPMDMLDNESKGYEWGLNAGVLVRKILFKDRISLYLLLSAGPHYISGAPERQSSGFIFSDNLFIGMTVKINENTHIDLRPGFRHLSNAGLTDRNGGINNVVFSGGIIFNLDW